MGSKMSMRVFRTARRIVIELPISVLPVALHAAPFNMDPDGDPAYHVTDRQRFADAVVEQLGEEQEDGTTPLHLLFDNAMKAAIEDGAEGADEYKRSVRRRERDRKAALAETSEICKTCGLPRDHEPVAPAPGEAKP